jgi:hypothetical protein
MCPKSLSVATHVALTRILWLKGSNSSYLAMANTYLIYWENL